jgi:trehalose 6-phosphate phosphatase
MIVRKRRSEPPSVEGMALFLDLDGTLAHIAPTPDEIVLDRRILDLFPRLRRRFNERVAIVSGRSIGNLDRILGESIIATAGVHGLERRNASGVRMNVPAHPKLAEVRQEFLRLAGVQPGLLVEDKGLGIALHYRGAPALAQTARELARRLAANTDLALQEGNMIVELLTPGQDKGTAVLAFMAETPFAGGVPVFVGDDLADEHAFAVASAHGGFGVQVGPERETKAHYRLADVEAVFAWLKTLAMESAA